MYFVKGLDLGFICLVFGKLHSVSVVAEKLEDE